jgi:aminopeptidase N
MEEEVGVRKPLSIRAAVCALVALAALALAAPAGAARYVKGADGVGDPFFPLAGNGGYDVRSYFLDLDYERAGNTLDGRVKIRARAEQNLRSFNLDFRNYEVARLRVNGREARFSRDGQELTLRPRPNLLRGSAFTVKVVYSGRPEAVIDPDGTSEGFVPTDDGAFVVNEPQGSPGWYPANDTPLDKARYRFKVTVPRGIVALANGELQSRRNRGGQTTWRWRERSPMAPYLATATSGPIETRFRVLRSGLPEYNAVDPDARAGGVPNPVLAWERLREQPRMVRFFDRLYGRYPFRSIGAIVDHAPEVGYALESQTKPNYSSVPSEATLVHEVAHQWFGNSVTLSQWPDIWLNEGFATWSEWIWLERNGGPSAQEQFDELYATPEDSPAGQDLWFPAPAAIPGPEELFSTPVYERGAMTLQALREKVGDRRFFRILRRWYSENRDGNVTTRDFIALSERVTDQRLERFFRVWLFREGKPRNW